MFFFGWGTKNKMWHIGDEYTLLANWQYFHIFFCPIASSVTWHILGDKRSEDRILTKEEIKKMFPEDKDRPDIGIWNKFGLLIAIGVIIILGIMFG